MTVRILNPAPAAYDLAQIKALAAARFGPGVDANTVRADDGTTQIAVYPASDPPAAVKSAWAADLAGYVVAHPTAEEQAANQTAILQRAQAALTANAAYLAIAAPTNADVVAQVQALTKECSAVIRLLLGRFDSTAGT